jgi:hypothetical protein
MKIIARERRVDLHLPMEVTGMDVRGEEFEESTRTFNISGGGICFESQRNILVGQRLILAIRLPEALRKHFGGHSTYRARAVVCRVERLEGAIAARIGARFLGAPDA